MTHYTVMVIGENIEEILAPYDENLQVDPYINTLSDKVLAEFEHVYNEYKNRKENGKELSEIGEYTLTRPPIREWWKRYHGEELDADGNALSTYNPDSKWDWYSVGGRWSGSLITKKQHTVDQAKKGDIDWDAMEQESYKDVLEEWDRWFLPKGNKDSYAAHYNKEYVLNERKRLLRVYGDRETYAKVVGKYAPYACVDTHGWHAPGRMGWFGSSSESNDEMEAWIKTFYKKFIEPLSDDTMITIVDCHI